MLCARFFISFYPWLVVAPSVISALNAARSCEKPQLFSADKLWVTTAPKRSDVATTQPEQQQPQVHQKQYQRQHLQHHRRRRHQRLSTSAFCVGHQRGPGDGEQQPHVVHDCTAINAEADNISNETQRRIDVDNENEIPTENRRVQDDLLSKNVAVVPQPSSSTPASASASSISSSTSSSSSSITSPSRTPLNFKLNRSLSRPKRYLAFPEGSSLSVAVCFTVGIIGNPRYDYMSFGLNWGVAYDLPNASWVLNHLHGFARRPVPPTVMRRRTRSMLYREVESALENMGYEGRDCVLRALCESRQYFDRTKMGMIGEMLRVIFSLPKQRIFSRELHENADIEVYDHAYRKRRAASCALRYPCAFSLLELALGRYSTPPAGYYKQH